MTVVCNSVPVPEEGNHQLDDEEEEEGSFPNSWKTSFTKTLMVASSSDNLKIHLCVMCVLYR